MFLVSAENGAGVSITTNITYASKYIVADYLRETEDILSYEPFLGVADPPQEAGGARGGVTSRWISKSW